MSAWKISVLPRFEIRTESGQIVSLRSRQYSELLAILTLAGPQGVELAAIGSDFFSEEWNDHKKALRNVVSRTKKHLELYSSVPLIRKDGEYVSLNRSVCQCDLWSLIEELERSPQSIGLDRIEQLLMTLKPPLMREQHVSSLVEALVSDCGQHILKGLEVLSHHPNRPGLRSLTAKVLIAVKPVLPYSTDAIQRQLAIFGRLRMRQEIIETLADYSEFLDSDLGDTPDRQLESFAETLLYEIDRSEVDPFAVPSLPHYFLEGIAPTAELAEVVESQDAVCVVGLPGVGKSSLLSEFAMNHIASSHQVAFIDLKEISRPIPFSKLVPRKPALILVDHYTPADSETISRIRELFPEAKLVVGGVGEIGFDTGVQVSVKPLKIGSSTEAGKADVLVKHLLSNRLHSASTINQLADVSQGVPAAIVRITNLVEEFGVDLAIHTFNQNRSQTGVGVFNSEQLLAQLSTRPIGCRAILSVLTGLRCPVSTLSLISSLQLGIEELRQLVALGLVELNRDQETVETPVAVSTSIEQIEGFGPGNHFQRVFEEYLTSKLQAQPPSDSNVFDIRVLEICIDQRSSRGDFRGALTMLRAIRIHLFKTRSCQCSLDGLDDELYKMDLPPDDCIDTLMALGAAHFYNFRQAEMVALLAEQRWHPNLAGATEKLRAEFYSQVGIATAIAGDKWGGIEALKVAAEIAQKPGLESIAVKVFYNLAATYYRVGKAELAIQNMSHAVALLKHVPTKSGRLELLHMLASYSYDVGLDMQVVKERYFVALSYARSNGLRQDAGWILGSLGRDFLKGKHHLQAVVVLTAGIRDELASELSPDFRRRCSFYFDLIAHCLLEMGYTALAYQSAVLAMNIMDDYYSRNEGFEQLGIKPIELPEGLRQASDPVTGGDILVFLSRVQQLTRQYPEAYQVLRDFGYLDSGETTDPDGTYSDPS